MEVCLALYIMVFWLRHGLMMTILVLFFWRGWGCCSNLSLEVNIFNNLLFALLGHMVICFGYDFLVNFRYVMLVIVMVKLGAWASVLLDLILLSNLLAMDEYECMFSFVRKLTFNVFFPASLMNDISTCHACCAKHRSPCSFGCSLYFFSSIRLINISHICWVVYLCTSENRQLCKAILIKAKKATCWISFRCLLFPSVDMSQF